MDCASPLSLKTNSIATRLETKGSICCNGCILFYRFVTIRRFFGCVDFTQVLGKTVFWKGGQIKRIRLEFWVGSVSLGTGKLEDLEGETDHSL